MLFLAARKDDNSYSLFRDYMESNSSGSAVYSLPKLRSIGDGCVLLATFLYLSEERAHLIELGAAGTIQFRTPVKCRAFLVFN